MSPPEKRFSVLTVTVTAAISFLVSGVGGALLQRYLARAKPLVTVTSTGFDGPDGFIQVPETILDLSRKDEWGSTLGQYEKFSTLRKREEQAAEDEAKLTKDIAIADNWLKEAQLGSGQAAQNEIYRHPIASGNVFIKSMHGNFRRREFGTPPVTNVSGYETVFPLYDDDNGPLMHMGLVSMLFPEVGLIDRQMIAHNRLAAESFAYGVRQNIVFYTKEFLEDERKNLLTIRQLREELRELLLQQAMPTVSVTFHNAGSTSVAFHPYFGMLVFGADRKSVTDRFLMLVDQSAEQDGDVEDELESIRQSLQGETQSREVNIEPFLPRVGGLAYSTIPPGESVSLRLVATESLGARGAQYRGAYDSGLLRMRILALTVAGKPIWSDITVTGANVNESAEKELLALME